MNTGAVYPALDANRIFQPLPPNTWRRGGVEALSSWVVRSASRHHMRPDSLMREWFGAASWRTPPMSKHTINGSRGLAQVLTKYLDANVRVPFSRQMTFMNLGEFADGSLRLLRTYRAWCSLCIGDCQKREVSPWDPLYTCSKLTTVCVRHGVALNSTCWRCDHPQPLMGKFALLDHCHRCGADLGAPPMPPRPCSGHEMWFSRAMFRVVEAMQTGRILTRQSWSSNLRAAASKFAGGNPDLLSTMVEVDEFSVRHWIDGVRTPHWASVFAVSRRLDTYPDLMLTDSSGESLPERFTPHRFPRIAKPRRYRGYGSSPHDFLPSGRPSGGDATSAGC